MKYPKNKKNSHGVSIIEIVVSMVLLMAVMMSLAFVYPNGRRLTNSSDYRTKAIEIAKSILEETKLIPFDYHTARENAGVASIVLLKRNAPLDAGLIALSDVLNQVVANNTLQWPYHHLSTLKDDGSGLKVPDFGTTWDATDINKDAEKEIKNKPVCPFFITDALPASGRNVARNHPNRPFFLLTGDSISVDRGGENTDVNSAIHPTLVFINIKVYWANDQAGSSAINFVTLCDSRTNNTY